MARTVHGPAFRFPSIGFGHRHANALVGDLLAEMARGGGTLGHAT